MGFFNDGIRSATRKAINRAGHAATDVGDTMPAFRETLNTANETFNRADGFISSLDGIEGRLTTKIEKAGEDVVSKTSSVMNVAKIGFGFGALKFCSDIGVSWYRAIKLTGIARNARNDLKKLADNTSKTEDEIVNVLKNTRGDLKSSIGQFTEDAHKMGQNFGHMTGALSQSSVEISGAVNQASRNFGYMTHVTSDFLAYLSQDIHQTSRCVMVTCISLTTSALAASMTYLQNSSCDRDQESMFCTAPLKSMAVVTIVTGFVAIRMLMPNRVQVHQNNEILTSNETMSVMDHPDQAQLKERKELNFLIPEEGLDQDVEWTKEELDSIKAINFDIFSFIEIKKQLGSKWHKQDLEWLLNQDKNIFLKVILSGAYTASDFLNNN